MRIEVNNSPSEQELRVLGDGIKSFNRLHMPEVMVVEPDTKFAVFVKDDSGKIQGGIRATAFWNYCMLELLWLSEDYRGTGIGSDLMLAAESFAKKKGFQYMRTETLNFQAKPFYEKLGYQVFGELVDYPKGFTTYCLVKAL